MYHTVARFLILSALLAALGAMAGCGNLPADDTASPAREEGSVITDCGKRSVSTIPGPGYVAMSVAFEADVQPADAPLAKIFFGSVPCWKESVSSALLMLYEVGPGGEVLAMISLMELDGTKVYMRTELPGDQRFEVADGCLALSYEADCVEFDLTDIPDGPCGFGWPVITRQGQAYGEPDGDYICMTGTVSYCSDCWVEGGTWHNDVFTGGSYVALGSIEDVLVAGGCGQPEEYVDIAAGDRVQFSLTSRITYRVSASPEQLGYERLELPTYP